MSGPGGVTFRNAVLMALICSLIVPGTTGYAGMENSEACTCNDLEDMQAMRDEADALYNAFVSVLGSFDRGNPPENWEEASNRASDLAFGTPEGGGSGSGSTPVSGFDAATNQPWINPDFAAAHCQQVSQSYIEHELEHIRYVDEVMAPNPLTGFINWIRAKVDPQWFAREMTKSDINAYHTQRLYLDRAIQNMKEYCDRTKPWECACSGQTFDSQAECEGNCHASLGCFNHICRETGKTYQE